jgi:hypothetical protein
MVKNNNGGNKAKGVARKNTIKRDVHLRVAREEGEIYAQAVKIMGGSIASAIDIYGNPLRAHIRGKFRGKGKRDNFISPNTWLLVGLHNWQTASNKTDVKDCDILEVYSEIDKNRLKNTVTNINWNIFSSNDAKNISDKIDNTLDSDESVVEFTDEIKEEYTHIMGSIDNKNMIIDDLGEEINVEDI